MILEPFTKVGLEAAKNVTCFYKTGGLKLPEIPQTLKKEGCRSCQKYDNQKQ